MIADKEYDSNALIDQIQKKIMSPLFLLVLTEKYPENMMRMYIKSDILSNAFLIK